MKFQYILGLSLSVCFLSACDSSSSSSNQNPVTQTPATTAPTPAVGGIDANPQNPVTPVDPATPSTPGSESQDLLGLKAGLSVNQSQFLSNLGSGISARTTEFRKATEALNASANAYCASYDASQLEDLKLRFRDAMMIWQNLELFQMGPLAENANALKFKIYGWPQLSNYCKIDEEAMLAVSDPTYALPSNTNRKGLQALEYMIYDASLVSICPASNPTKAEWEAQTSAQKWASRCAYMKPVAAELQANAQSLETLWGTSTDNVVSRKIPDPAAAQSVIQDLFNNLFYIDLEVKNQKLAAPAGQDIKVCNKSPSPCADKEELRYSHLSKEAMAQNIRALADVIFGFGEPRTGGLTALLRGENGAGIAATSEKNVTNLVTLSETESATFDSLLTSKKSEDCETSQISWVCKVRQALKDVSADFKGEYTSILKTTVPVAPQGDND